MLCIAGSIGFAFVAATSGKVSKLKAIPYMKATGVPVTIDLQNFGLSYSQPVTIAATNGVVNTDGTHDYTFTVDTVDPLTGHSYTLVGHSLKSSANQNKINATLQNKTLGTNQDLYSQTTGLPDGTANLTAMLGNQTPTTKTVRAVNGTVVEVPRPLGNKNRH